MRYPDDPRPLHPYNFRANRPVVGGGPEWAPQIRALTRYGLGEADLVYHGKTWEEIAILYDFFEAIHGPAGRFTFIDFNGIGRPSGADPGVTWANLFVAKGDGITLAWDSPTFGTVAGAVTITDEVFETPLVFENNVPVIGGCDIYTTTPEDTKSYHLKSGGGTDGVDLLTAEAAITTVATAPDPATSGTALIVATGKGARFPDTPFFASIWPTAVAPSSANAEIVEVTDVTTDTLTITRAQRNTAARTVVVGDQIAVPPGPGVIVSISATCRRAFRRARFMNARNPFTLEVPSNYGLSQITIIEVRK